MTIEAERIVLIYTKRWQIELFFKHLKQNFPLKYFLGDNVNTTETELWTAMLANLLITLVKGKVKKNRSFAIWFHYKAAINVLHQPVWLVRRSEKKLTQSDSTEKNEIPKFSVPENKGGYF